MDEKYVQGERKKEDELKDERKMEDENMENEEIMEDDMKMRDEKVKDEKKMEDDKEVKHEMKIGDEKKKGEKKMQDNPEMEMENKDKRKEYELKRIRLFQWKRLNAHPWLLINLVPKDTTEPVIIHKPYPHEQPGNTLVQSMYCGMCSKHPSVASKDNEISKRSGTNNFKLEALKKRDKKWLEAERAINNPKATEMYKCCKQLYEKDDEKMEKKFKTAFHIAVLERPLDDYESLCPAKVEQCRAWRNLLHSICMYGIY